LEGPGSEGKREEGNGIGTLGVFKVVVHRDFPLDEVKRAIVKLTPSGKVHIIFVVNG
jgi:putative transposase